MSAPVNPQKYLELLEAGLGDKLFFTDHIDLKEVDVFVDYGCADGALLQGLNRLIPNKKIIGFDENTQFLDCAQKRLENDNLIRNKDFILENEWVDISERLFDYNEKGLKTCIILSSVLHELKSAHSKSAYQNILDEIFNIADYVVIRDMGMDYDEGTGVVPKELVDPVINKSDYFRITSFCRKYKSISNIRNFVHYLLKYPYKENWKNEILEDYIIYWDDLYEEIEKRDYMVIYSSFYTHPFIKKLVKELFDIDLTYNTHFKFIARKLK